MATRKDVARRAGVSVAVVSYVINHKKHVKEETRERVWQAIAELNYQPNPAARSLKTKKAEQLAVLVNDLMNPFEAELLSCIERSARRKGYTVFFQSYAKAEEENLKAQLTGRADGILLMGQSLGDQVFRYFQDLGVPLLSVTRPVWERESLPVIDMNWVAEMRKIVRHLKALGHQSAGFMTNGDPGHPHTQRFQGFMQAAQYEGLPFQGTNLLHGGGTFQKAYSVMLDKIKSGPTEFTAIICANDLMAAGVIAACKEAEWQVPERMAVVGCENILMSSQITPPLTTLHYPKEQLAELAVLNMVNAVKGVSESGFTFEGDLLVRASTVRF